MNLMMEISLVFRGSTARVVSKKRRGIGVSYSIDNGTYM